MEPNLSPNINNKCTNSLDKETSEKNPNDLVKLENHEFSPPVSDSNRDEKNNLDSSNSNFI